MYLRIYRNLEIMLLKSRLQIHEKVILYKIRYKFEDRLTFWREINFAKIILLQFMIHVILYNS